MPIVILVTCANKKEAKGIAEALVKDKAAACVNMVDRIESIFRWQGKVSRSKEVLLMVKSQKSKLSRIIKLIKSRHSYKVPEIIALSIISGYKPYLEWINDSVR